MNNISVWLIIPQTNLHVGNENTVNFSVIDKSIQRDVTTDLPCINSSSLKGAIKEFMTEYLNTNAATVQDIFGSIKSDTKNIKKGSAVFFDASLLFIPKQCSTGKAFELIYCDEVLNDFSQKVNNIIDNNVNNNLSKDILLQKVRSIIGTCNVAQTAVSQEEFRNYCNNDSLPIISRNCLENGESVNLWYEQVLPSYSVLSTIISTKNQGQLDILNNKIIQIGANGTIGYGYCKFIELNK